MCYLFIARWATILSSIVSRTKIYTTGNDMIGRARGMGPQYCLANRHELRYIVRDYSIDTYLIL